MKDLHVILSTEQQPSKDKHADPMMQFQIDSAG